MIFTEFNQWNGHKDSFKESKCIYATSDNGKEKQKIVSTSDGMSSLMVDTRDVSNKILLGVPVAGITSLKEKLSKQVHSESKTATAKKAKVDLEKLESGLKQLTAEVKSEGELENAASELAQLDLMAGRLKKPSLDYIDLTFLLNSEVSAFLDTETIREIQDAVDKLSRADEISEIVRSTDFQNYLKIAKNEWDIDYAPSAKFLKKRLKADQRKWLEKELSDKRKKKEWIEKQALKIEDSNLVGLRNRVGSDLLVKLQAILYEARELKANAAIEFLKNRLSKIKNKFIESFGAKSGKVSRGNRVKVERYLHDLKTALQSPDIRTPKHLVKISENLNSVGKIIDSISTESNEAIKNPAEILNRVRSNFAQVQQMRAVFTKERGETLKTQAEAVEAEEVKKLKEEGNGKDIGKQAILKKKIDTINSLTNGDEQMEAENKRLETLLKKSDEEVMKELSAEELLAMDKELQALTRSKLGLDMEKKWEMSTENPNGTILSSARSMMRKLSQATSVREIRSILESQDNSQVEVVSGRRFRNYKDSQGKKFNLTKHTKANMAFYVRGDEWKIIIDKEAFSSAAKLRSTKNQIIHELRHLEFEKDDALRNAWISDYTSSPNWEAIKSAFHKSFPNKKPPQYADGIGYWNDEDIVNELFAMQHDIQNADKSSKFANLRKAVVGAGIGKSAFGIKDESARIYGAETDDMQDYLQQSQSQESTSATGVQESANFSSASDNQHKLSLISKEIDDYLHSEYISRIPGTGELLSSMKSYNEDTQKLNDELAKEPSEFLSEKIEERMELVKGDLKSVKEEVEKSAKEQSNDKIGIFREIWNDSVFLSLNDFIQVGVDIKEWYDRRYKRRKADHAARIGSALFEGMPLPIIGEFGAEADARSQKAEADEVNEWKSRLENKDAWQLIDMLHGMADELDPNKDQLKAVLRILADKGRLNWTDQKLWIILSKLQSSTPLSPNDKILLENPVLLRQKLHTAIGEIYDYDEFLALDNKNTSAYDSGKKEYMEMYNNMQGQLDERLREMLANHEDGKNVDPIEFEAILEYAITNGKSSAENVIFNLITAMGKGLLSPDRGTHLDKLLNQFPALEYLTNMGFASTQSNFNELCETYFADEYKEGKKEVGSDFHNFYWTVMVKNERVVERVEKSTSERAWDHDWSRAIAPLGSAETANRFLAGRSGQKETKPTAVQNAYVGALQWLEENAKKGADSFENGLARQIGWIAMAGGIMENVAFRENKIYTRKEALASGAIARESGAGYHPSTPAFKQRERIENVMKVFDPVFFSLITNKEMADEGSSDKDSPILKEAIKDHLMAAYGDDPEMESIVKSIGKLDDVFSGMQNIVNIIISANKNKIPEAMSLLLDQKNQPREIS